MRYAITNVLIPPFLCAVFFVSHCLNKRFDRFLILFLTKAFVALDQIFRAALKSIC